MMDEHEMDSLYNEDEPTKEGPEESVDQEEAHDMEHSSVVPISVLQGEDKQPVKVGDEIVVKVTALHGDDEASIVYAPKKKEMSDDEELDALAKDSYGS